MNYQLQMQIDNNNEINQSNDQNTKNHESKDWGKRLNNHLWKMLIKL